jgi:cell division protein FtsB
MISSRQKFQNGKENSVAPFSFIAGLVLLGVIGYLAIADWRIYRAGAELKQRLTILQEQMQKLEQRNAELEMLLAKTQTEDYLEKTARERLNLKKPGENVVAIVPPEKQEAGLQKTQETKQTFWQKILEKVPFLQILR